MTIAASGPLKTAAIRTEYGGTTPMRLSTYRRGDASGYVKNKAANNLADNNSAAVPTSGPLRMANFRGQAIGYTYTNTTLRATVSGHYYCHLEFGDDWATSSWPMTYINNATIGSTATTHYALVIYGRTVGPFTFINNSNIQGCGGNANSGAGQHAVYINNSEAGANRPIFINNVGATVAGGGGGGGQGGTGGRGGATSHITYSPGPGNTQYTYSRGMSNWRTGSNAVTTIFWSAAAVYTGAAPSNPWVSGANAYYTNGVARETYDVSGVTCTGHEIRRQATASSTAGGLGGAGGNGGKGQGYNSAKTNGVAGAVGSAGTAYGSGGAWSSGSGGTGGTGGNGGSFGSAGVAGNTGATGNPGTTSVAPLPTAGSAGSPAGASGYSIYAMTPWGLTNSGTLLGLTGGGVAPT